MKPTYPSPSQVFISYGAQSNGSLFQYYGFTEPGNPNDVYAFEAQLGGQAVQVGSRSAGTARARGRRLGTLWPGARTDRSAPIHMQLTVNAKGSFAADCQAAARTALGGSSVDDAALRAALLVAAEAELAGKPTSAADDERLLQVCAACMLSLFAPPHSHGRAAASLRTFQLTVLPLHPRQTAHLMAPRQRAAAEFRLEKKRVLERAVGRSRKRLAKATGAA